MSKEDWKAIQRNFNFPYGNPTTDAIRSYCIDNKKRLLERIAAQIPAVSPPLLVVSLVTTGNVTISVQTDPATAPPAISSPTVVIQEPIINNEVKINNESEQPGPSGTRKRIRRTYKDLLNTPKRHSPRNFKTRLKEAANRKHC